MRAWVQRLVLSVRSLRFPPSLDENELSKTKEKPRRISGFGQADNLVIREQCEMLETSATRKLEIPFPFCS